MNMQIYARRLFSIAALFNFGVAGGLLFLQPWLIPLLQLDPITGTNAALVKVLAVLVATFGYAYWRIAGDPVTFRPYVTLGVIGKLLVVAAAGSALIAGETGWRLPVLAAGDLLFAGLFLDYLRRTKSA